MPWTWPAESTKVRLEHWHPQLVSGDAAFRSLLTTFSKGEQEARARVARKTFDGKLRNNYKRKSKQLTREFMAVLVRVVLCGH